MIENAPENRFETQARGAGISRFRTAALALALGATALSAPAMAQEESAQASDEAGDDNRVVIRGQVPLSEKETKKIADRFVKELTVISNFDPLTRYEPEVYCPGVVGLTENGNAAIEARMRTVAEAAGVRPAKPGCATSALVVLVDDKPAFLKQFRKAHPIYFQNLDGDLGGIGEEDGPSIAWHLSALIDENGTPSSLSAGGMQVYTSSSGGSRLHSMLTAAIAMSVVVIEREALIGLSVEQVADYALMRSLTNGDPAKLEGSGAATILTVLSTPMGEESYASLTDWDLAYLQERYKGDPRMYGERKGSALRASVRRASDEQPATTAAEGE